MREKYNGIFSLFILLLFFLSNFSFSIHYSPIILDPGKIEVNIHDNTIILEIDGYLFVDSEVPVILRLDWYSLAKAHNVENIYGYIFDPIKNETIYILINEKKPVFEYLLYPYVFPKYKLYLKVEYTVPSNNYFIFKKTSIKIEIPTISVSRNVEWYVCCDDNLIYLNRKTLRKVKSSKNCYLIENFANYVLLNLKVESSKYIDGLLPYPFERIIFFLAAILFISSLLFEKMKECYG